MLADTLLAATLQALAGNHAKGCTIPDPDAKRLSKG